MRSSFNWFITVSKGIKNTIHYNDLRGNYWGVDTMMKTGVVKTQHTFSLKLGICCIFEEIDFVEGIIIKCFNYYKHNQAFK